MNGAPVFSAAFHAELEALFRWRRDVRRFRRDPLDESLLERLIALTATAPSVGYSQPARFVRVDSAQRRAAVIKNFEECNAAAALEYHDETADLYARLKLEGLREAPLHLAVYSDESTARGKGLGRVTMPETLAYSTVTAILTFWLAARAQGVGVGWVSIIDPDAVRAILDVPHHWRLIAYLCVGYPLEEHLDRELVRAGWESTDPAATVALVR